jgi:hypothetical protein
VSTQTDPALPSPARAHGGSLCRDLGQRCYGTTATLRKEQTLSIRQLETCDSCGRCIEGTAAGAEAAPKRVASKWYALKSRGGTARQYLGVIPSEHSAFAVLVFARRALFPRGVVLPHDFLSYVLVAQSVKVSEGMNGIFSERFGWFTFCARG